MLYRIGADAVVIFHFCFVAFVVTGGLIVLRWRRVMWAHLPAVAWGVFVEFSHRICPLTPLENHLRELGGQSAYQGGFVDHYIMPVLYPEGLTERTQVILGSLILVINVICYAAIVYRWRASRRRALAPAPARIPENPAEVDAPPEPATRPG
jgi:hypothetical protein